MSLQEWRPWWKIEQKKIVTDDRAQFVAGAKTSGTSDILLAILAGYVGGKIAQRKPGEK